ncbi:MAG: hypothetical protein O6946_06390 [Gammaproteobacteria bacterium]|nr:hypothetical protein [Gammaproteobacteria bacterium]MCZ6716676.1 hypothetical protein [Gammaproteobacteria bacterium]MCZ6911598.1 hypothetical protein [Pseudomonadota bacterium]
MPNKNNCLALLCCCLLIGCTGSRPFTETCPDELSRGWAELDLAEAVGVDGKISLAKAVGLLTAAKAMQLAEKYERCYELAKEARAAIKKSRQ